MLECLKHGSIITGTYKGDTSSVGNEAEEMRKVASPGQCTHSKQKQQLG